MRTSEFLEDVRRHISVPTYQPRFSPDDILKLASMEQKITLMPIMTSLREEFFIVEDYVTFPATTGKLQIPARAAGRTIRDIWWSSVDDSADLDNFKKLAKIELEEILQFRVNSNSGGCYAWYIMADFIYAHPPSDSASYAWLKYTMRPSELVQEDRTANIESLTYDTLTVDAVPDNIIVGSVCDITNVEPGYELKYRDLTVTQVSATTITFSGFTALLPLTGVVAGDVVSLRRETSVIHFPEDAHESLIWATTKAMAVSLGIRQFIEDTEKELKGSIQSLRDMCAPRAENSRPKVLNPRGLLRSNLYARRFPMVTV